VLSGECALQTVGTIVHTFNGEAFGAEAFHEESAQLDIIVDDENAFHSLEPAASELILDDHSAGKGGLYKTLCCLTNLYRTQLWLVLKSKSTQ
jgi:hypothetical protein